MSSTTTPLPRKRIIKLQHIYLLISLISFIWLLYYFCTGAATNFDFNIVKDNLFINNSGAALLSADFLMSALTAVIFMIVEAKRMGMKWYLYIILSIIAPVAIVFPIFLYQRELKRNEELIITNPTGMNDNDDNDTIGSSNVIIGA
jgi:hypothetical protein